MSPVVDGHAHVFMPASERYPRDVHPMFPAELAAPVEDLLAEMEAAGVDHAVLVPVSPHDDYLRECLARYPGVFAGIGVHDPGARAPVDDMRRRVSKSGLSGLRVHHLGDEGSSSFDESPGFELLSAMAKDGLILWYYAPADQLPLLEAALERLPRLTVVLNHLGFPMPDEFELDSLGRPTIDTELPPPTLGAVESLARFDGVNVMFSGEYAFSRREFPFDDLAEVVQRLYRAYGAERMMWASDFPWTREQPRYAPQLDLVERYLPECGPDERATITGRTGARLFGL